MRYLEEQTRTPFCWRSDSQYRIPFHTDKCLPGCDILGEDGSSRTSNPLALYWFIIKMIVR